MKKRHIIYQASKLSNIARIVILMIASLVLAGCCSNCDDQQSQTTYLDQGWSPDMREDFYYTPQGSHLIPYKWFLALEQGDGSHPFSSPDNLARYGYLLPLEGPSELNPDGLPVGFTKERIDGLGPEQWLGLTCAACHTNDISYRGQTVRIDGAPSLSDFHKFLTELTAAVAMTRLDTEKFERFAISVLGETSGKDEKKQLYQAFNDFSFILDKNTQMRSLPLMEGPPAGPGRTDALGQIINELSVTFLHEAGNERPISAPVSYPFLWYTPRLEWVQWIPIANNPIARNAGEALGVFGSANFTGPEDKLFTSSANFSNLYDLEKWVDDLKSPKWPEEVFGTIDTELAASGAALFKKNCLGCHNMPPFRMSPKGRYIDPEKQFIEITAIKSKHVGTDQKYSDNFLTRMTKTGALKDLVFEGAPEVPGAIYFTATVGATLNKGFDVNKLTLEQRLAYSDYRFHPMKEGDTSPNPYSPDPEQLKKLKAGPLMGIWATGPFLHNGSVANIYELLSKPEERSEVFWVGNIELDTEYLGFVSEEKRGLFRFDTREEGNGNGGHAFPASGLTHEERMALIEFLKKPTPFNVP